MAFISLNNVPIRSDIIDGAAVSFVHSENTTLAFWKYDEGVIVPSHSHPHEQITNVISGRFEWTIGTETKLVSAGDVCIIPSNVVHHGRALTPCEVIDVFYPIREDYVSETVQMTGEVNKPAR